MTGMYGLTTFGEASEIDYASEISKLQDLINKLSTDGINREEILQQKKLANLQSYYDLQYELEAVQVDWEEDLHEKLKRKELADRLNDEKEYQAMVSELYMAELERRAEAKEEMDEEDKARLLEKIKLEAKQKQQQKKADEKAEKKKQARKAGTAQAIEKFDAVFAKGATPKERLAAVKNLAKGPDGKTSGKALVGNLTAGLAGLAKQLENKMDEVGKHKAGIDTRLYGSTTNDTSFGSYFDKISQTFTGIAGASPFILQADLISNLETLVGKGISYNIQQRAFLATVSDKIATTFEVTDGTLLKLVRIQQADSTAGRLGMESALNAFLNNMYETTEYLSNLADTVREGLYEAQALMGAEQAAEFEFQVQKWLGSMYSVGMSDQVVTSLSTALGQLAAGDINALTGDGMGNLLVMAANQTGISIAEVLEKGLDSDTTNQLLEAAVEYLAQIGAQSDSKVIQQQLASVFGMKASDLKAIATLKSKDSVSTISETTHTYASMVKELNDRANTMYQRISVGEMMSNVWQNVQYSVAAGMANNPVTYLLYKVGGLLEETTGGIDLPFLNVYGFGVDLNTTVAQLMQAGAMAGGVLGSLGQMIGGLAKGAGGGFSGAGMLKALEVSENANIISRGAGTLGTNALTSGAEVSTSGLSTLNANGSSADIEAATLAQAADDKQSMLQKGTEEFDSDATNKDIIAALGENSTITKDGLAEIVHGLQELASALGADNVLMGSFTGNVGINSQFGG